MRETDDPGDEATIAVDPGIECPLCHEEKHTSLEEHLLERHTPEELADLVTKFVLEREETGAVR